MSRKSKGINAERELLHLLWKNGWACIRVAGSGASRYPTPDLVAGNKNRVLAIECKSGKGPYQYLEQEEIEHLVEFSKIFGAEPWIGVRFNNEDWSFYSPKELGTTKTSFVVTKESKGKNFLDLINETSKAF
ncbi:MAG: Holliday junction resolvase Hjc [Candidatus Woesearchaeota archaeon]